VLVPSDGRLAGGIDEKGRVYYDSEPAGIPIPSDGIFAFEVEDVALGTYLIAVQHMDNSFAITPFLVAGDEYANFEVADDVQPPLIIEVGK
jgi:hypothetical protein